MQSIWALAVMRTLAELAEGDYAPESILWIALEPAGCTYERFCDLLAALHDADLIRRNLGSTVLITPKGRAFVIEAERRLGL